MPVVGHVCYSVVVFTGDFSPPLLSKQMHNITVFYKRYYVAYERSAAQMIETCRTATGYSARDVYDALNMLEMHEYCYSGVCLLKDYQDEQIPLRFE